MFKTTCAGGGREGPTIPLTEPVPNYPLTCSPPPHTHLLYGPRHARRLREEEEAWVGPPLLVGDVRHLQVRGHALLPGAQAAAGGEEGRRRVAAAVIIIGGAAGGDGEDGGLDDAQPGGRGRGGGGGGGE